MAVLTITTASGRTIVPGSVDHKGDIAVLETITVAMTKEMLEAVMVSLLAMPEGPGPEEEAYAEFAEAYEELTGKELLA